MPRSQERNVCKTISKKKLRCDGSSDGTKDDRYKKGSSSTKTIDSSSSSEYSDQSSERSLSAQRMFSPVYYRRSIERTYYSPDYCPWSRNSSSERESSNDYTKRIKFFLKSVSIWKRTCLFYVCIVNTNAKHFLIIRWLLLLLLWFLFVLLVTSWRGWKSSFGTVRFEIVRHMFFNWVKIYQSSKTILLLWIYFEIRRKSLF